MINSKHLLLLGAWFNVGIALLHIGIIIIGAPAYLYFGAADLAILAYQGSPLPAIITSVIVVFFIVFSLYGFAGAGALRRLPLLRTGLILIGGVYTLRGLIVIFDLIRLVRGADYSFRQTVFSATALMIGLFHVIGTWRRWIADSK
jgi:hypothetical protein